MHIQYKYPHSKEESFLKDAIKWSYQCYTEELDCNISFCRRLSDKTAKEVLDMCSGGKFVHKSIFLRESPGFNADSGHYEVCLNSAVEGVDYFLWVKLDIKNGEKLIKKYRIKPYEF